jgi:hypothetical protein
MSILMFVVLIIGQVRVEYSGIAKKQYQLVARLVNILFLSVSIILIMIVLLQWFHPPSHSTKPIRLTLTLVRNGTNQTSYSGRTQTIWIPPNNPSYLKALGIQRQPLADYRQKLNHGPNLFFAAFIIIFLALLGFVLGYQIDR